MFAYWYGNTLYTALERGMMKTVYGLLGFAALLMLPLILGKVGMFPLFCFLISIYFLPFQFGFFHFFGPIANLITPTEFGIYFFLALILFSELNRSFNNKWTTVLTKLPVFPFALYITGAVVAYFIGAVVLHSTISSSIYKIRVLCLYPAIICVLCMYLIDTSEKAEKLIWVFLISTSILGILILSQGNIGFITGSSYAEGTGRLSMAVSLPLMGDLVINPTVASSIFSIAFTLSFIFFLKESPSGKFYLAGVIISICVLVMAKSQGRGGLIAAICSVAVIWLLLNKSKVLSVKFAPFKISMIGIAMIGVIYNLSVTSKLESFRMRYIDLFTDPLNVYTLVERTQIWKETIPIIIKYPFGIGAHGLVGVGNTLLPDNIDGSIWAVHNLLLYLLLFSGVIGTIGFLLIFYWFIRKCIKGLHSQDKGICLFSIAGIGITTVFFVNGIASPIIGNSVTATVFWLPIGIIMAVINLPDRRNMEKRTNE